MGNPPKFSLNPSLKRREIDKFGRDFQVFTVSSFICPLLGAFGVGSDEPSHCAHLNRREDCE
jgi:hypothetical protein